MSNVHRQPADAARPAVGPRPRSRLPREIRREQLIAAATPLVAAHGLSEFSLEDVAARADVTRNLLYHYFPRGRADLAVAAVDWAGRQLTDDWSVDESAPLAERLAANLSRLIDHASAPSEAWRIYRHSRSSTDPDIARTVARYRGLIVATISLNQAGTPNPPPPLRLALEGYLGFAETLLDRADGSGVPRDAVLRLLGDTLGSVVASARSVVDGQSMIVDRS